MSMQPRITWVPRPCGDLTKAPIWHAVCSSCRRARLLYQPTTTQLASSGQESHQSRHLGHHSSTSASVDPTRDLAKSSSVPGTFQSENSLGSIGTRTLAVVRMKLPP